MRICVPFSFFKVQTDQRIETKAKAQSRKASGVLAVDAKWLAGARDENRLDMIDRRRPQPWTHAEEHEIINQDLLIIGERCVLLAGYRGKKQPAPVCLLTEARSRLRVGYDALWDRTRLILTKR